MHRWLTILAASTVALVASLGSPASAEGDPAQGKRAFLACAACHSAEPNVHKTGPSLADIWGREAGTVEGFTRYSDALKNADVVWHEGTLDRWLQNPKEFVPGNTMTFRGIPDKQQRQDIIAYLERLGAHGGDRQAGQPAPEMGGGMMGMTGGEMINLRAAGPAQQVVAIRHCGDTYRVTTADGESVPFWEFNLRFKTDSSKLGPPEGRPALLPASMMGDRAFVIFSSPEEISAFIKEEC